MTTIRVFSPEVQVLTCPLPFLSWGRLSFAPNISHTNIFKLHKSCNKFNLSASKKLNKITSSDLENIQSDLNPPKKETRGRKKKSLKENPKEDDLEPVQNEETNEITKFRKRPLTTTQKPKPKSNEVLNKLITLLDRLIKDGTGEVDTWRPLIGCFGPAKNGFIPFAKPATRVLDREMHLEMIYQYRSLENKFFRACGSSSNKVAISLAREGEQVEFIGKIGNDFLGLELISQLRKSGVKTRGVKRENSKSTGVSYMKLTSDKNGDNLSAKYVKKCAEDCFGVSDIEEDVLKKAKLLYFNSSSLLDPDVKSALIESIKITKSNGGQTFFDLNLPLYLWKSCTEIKALIEDIIPLCDFIEFTSQELSFLMGVSGKVSDGFETVYMKWEQDKAFGHVEREEVKKHFWHDNLKVIFVTDGTSRVHYYTSENDGFIRGSESLGIEPNSCEFSAAADRLVAEIMRMIISVPGREDLLTDPEYLEPKLYDASRRGFLQQWMVVKWSGFFDSDSESESEEEEEEDKSESEDDEKDEEIVEEGKELFELKKERMYDY